MSDWRTAYKERYAKLKEKGKSFFPYAVSKDTLVAFLVLCAIGFLAYKYGAALEDVADPTDTTYNPRPEWYFLFLFQALKLFPGRLEPVATVILPGFAVFLLLLVPFLDRGPNRHPLDRLGWTALGLLVLGGISYLTWAGFRSPMTNPIVEKNPMAAQGQRLYQDLKCYYCHAINGQGGHFAPDLSQGASQKSDEWLVRHFRDPQALVPGSKMPKLNLLDDEIQDLVAYIKTLGVQETYTSEAPKLFKANCMLCHRLGSEGESIGPDLSMIGLARDRAYLKRYISDPMMANPNSSMPGFKGQLTDLQLDDVARYLTSQKGDKKSTK